MRTKKQLRYGAGLLVGLRLGVGTILGAPEYDQNIEKAFPANSGGRLIVQADQGSIEINSDVADTVRVRVLRHVKGGSQAQADELFTHHDVTFTQDRNSVSVIGRSKKDRFRFGGFRQPNLQVRYAVSIPRRFDVDLKTAGGDIRLSELEGAAVARTSSGTIDLGRISGRIESINSGGDILVTHAGGDLVAHTSGGSIKVQTAWSPALQAAQSLSRRCEAARRPGIRAAILESRQQAATSQPKPPVVRSISGSARGNV